MPRLLAMSPTSVGSMPSTRWPPLLKFDSSVPSLEPISTTRSSCAEAQHAGRLALQVGEIVAQQFGGAAGIGIFGREDNGGIDRQAELHQLAIAAMQEIGREPRLLMRHGPDRHHLVDRRHVAERKHVGKRRVAADLAAFDWNAAARAGGARYFGRTQGINLHTQNRLAWTYNVNASASSAFFVCVESWRLSQSCRRRRRFSPRQAERAKRRRIRSNNRQSKNTTNG